MNGWLMWLGYGANQFLVTCLVALTQKVKARGSAPGRGVRARPRPGTLRKLRRYWGGPFTFLTFIVFYWSNKRRRWWVARWSPLPHSRHRPSAYFYPANPQRIHSLLRFALWFTITLNLVFSSLPLFFCSTEGWELRFSYCSIFKSSVCKIFKRSPGNLYLNDGLEMWKRYVW